MATGQHQKRRKQGESSSREQFSDHLVFDAEVGQSLLQNTLHHYEKLVRDAFDKRREFYVHSLVQELRKMSETEAVQDDQHLNDWLPIESLTKLRGLVGGRFQNIKLKWTGAGFPLKEHRGGKLEPYEVNKSGWLELSNWIVSQGYEARLPVNGNGGNQLFEIRPLKT